MALKKFQLVDIGEAGASFAVDASKWQPFELKDIATAVSAGGGMLTVKNAARLQPFQLKDIATAGKGHIFYELEGI